MADIFSKEKRSEVMSKITGKDTKPEIVVRKYLFSRGLRFRKNDKRYPGKPDVVLPKYRTMVFVHGCFWHGHADCNTWRPPLSNVEFWRAKIGANIIRDRRHTETLLAMGWNILVMWECEIKSKKDRPARLERLYNQITAHKPAG